MARSCLAATALWMAVTLTLAACETSFDVFSDSEQYYSLFGYLDASADTQWVRVELLHDSLLTDTGPIDAVMLMTTMSSGKTTEWSDSLFSFIGGGRAHNFWAVEPIAPLETYRIEVIRADGASSIATVTLPEAFDDPVFNTFPFSLINLPVSGSVCARQIEMLVQVETLAALEIQYVLPTRSGPDRIYRVDYVPKAVEYEEGFYEVTFAWAADLVELADFDPEVRFSDILQLKAVRVRVAAAGPNWPDNALSDETVALPGAVTFVENGLGFVGGVVSKLIDLPMGTHREPSCFE